MLPIRYALFATIGWAGLLQSWSVTEISMRLIGAASVLGTLTVLVYRLGVWRQEMENTKHNVYAEVKACREESAECFTRLERRLEAIDHVVSMTNDARTKTARWQSRVERRLERIEERDRADDA